MRFTSAPSAWLAGGALAFGLARGGAAEAAMGNAPEPGHELRITVAAVDWGGAEPENIRAVLASAAGQLWQYCPQTRLPPIHVGHTDRDPIVLFAPRSDGAVEVRLDSGGRLWAQFAYQFSHEFAHVLAVHVADGRARRKNATHANQWFEESLGETASLFALESMAQAWQREPPYPNWKSYAAHLGDYARERRQDPRHQLPAGQSFAQWFREHEAGLRTNATQRAWNSVIALRMLPCFQRSPTHWEALTALNLGAPAEPQPFARYLREWRANAGEKHRQFIAELAGLFAVKLDAP